MLMSLKNCSRHCGRAERPPDVRLSRAGHVQSVGGRVSAERHRHVVKLSVGLSERGRDDAPVHHSVRLPG